MDPTPQGKTPPRPIHTPMGKSCEYRGRVMLHHEARAALFFDDNWVNKHLRAANGAESEVPLELCAVVTVQIVDRDELQ